MSCRLSSRISLVIAGLLMSAAWAQTSKTGPKYDVKNEVKVKGAVQEVREVPGPFEGTQLVVKTETKTILVHVAPSGFLKEMDT